MKIDALSWCKNTPVVYVDVDGTLLLWPGKAGRVPRPGEAGHGELPTLNQPLIDALKRWHRDGKVLVLWSRGGTEHCRFAAKLCGLDPDACLPKPKLAIDDGPRSVTAGEDRGFVVIGPHGEYPLP